jgi:DUF1009 family protein
MSLRSDPTRTGTSNTITTSKKTLGIVAGMGDLPVLIAEEAKKIGYRVVAVALQPPADESLRPIADIFHKIHIGRFGEIVKALKKSSVSEVVFAGKVPKSLLYEHKKSFIPDLKAMKLLFSLKNRSDSSFMKVISDELEAEGIKLLRATSIAKDILTPEGVLTRKKLKKDQLKDISFGWKIAKGIGKLDIGQTIVVKDLAVMSVEAIEGTDEAIKRGGSHAGGGSVAVKVSKPGQDMRLDVPVVGPDTIQAMKKAGVEVLALEADKSIIVDRERVLREADKAGIVVVGIRNA